MPRPKPPRMRTAEAGCPSTSTSAISSADAPIDNARKSGSEPAPARGFAVVRVAVDIGQFPWISDEALTTACLPRHARALVASVAGQEALIRYGTKVTMPCGQGAASAAARARLTIRGQALS